MGEWRQEWKKLVVLVGAFLLCFYLPVGRARFDSAIMESLHLVKWYAREHVLLCLVPAFFIAGAIAVFVSRSAVMKYLGTKAHKVLAYGVASVSGTILAVCSCTVLPLFAGIYKMGAGIGPATAFLYSGPAINVLAIALTARVLGPRIGIARAIGAVLFSIVIGLLMHLIFRREDEIRTATKTDFDDKGTERPLWQNAIYLFSMVAFMVFANWGKPMQDTGLWHVIHSARWILTGIASAVLVVALALWFRKRDFTAWFEASWGFAKQILPLLLAGVLVAGLLLGSPGSTDGGLIPSTWITELVGGNSLRANLFASVVGAFMYFATLTEVPILKGLLSNGMGEGPALALLLAGPALSLPNMLVMRNVLGTKKTAVFVLLVIAMATISGIVFGWIA